MARLWPVVTSLASALAMASSAGLRNLSDGSIIDRSEVITMQSAIQAYRLETSLTVSGTLTIDHLPFEAGDRVEVIVLPQIDSAAGRSSYPLRGAKIEYVRPFETVAEDEWDNFLARL